MKKLLLGSTALLLSAGVAAAEIRTSGDGRFGVVYENRTAPGAAEVTTGKFAFSQRMRVTFNASGSTDTGLNFGGFARIQLGGNTGGAFGGSFASGQQVFVSGAFGRLEVGDVEGAVQSAVGDLHEVGFTGLRFNNENVFFQRRFGGGFKTDAVLPAVASGGPNVRYSYNIGDVSLFASMSQIAPDTRVRTYAAGAAFTFEGFRIGAGVERADVPGATLVTGNDASFNHAAISARGTFDNIEVRATYGRISSSAIAEITPITRRDQYGVSASAAFDPITVLGYARRDFFNRTHYGLGAAYNLGGGAVIRGGIQRSTAPGEERRNAADIGINLSF